MAIEAIVITHIKGKADPKVFELNEEKVFIIPSETIKIPEAVDSIDQIQQDRPS